MFSSIQIQNFRSCKNVALSELGNILVLIGRNGAGKTNILKAIEWACYVASHAIDKAERVAIRTINQIGEVAFVFKLHGKEYCYRQHQTFDFSPDKPPVRQIQEHLHIFSEGAWTLLISRDGENLVLYTNEDTPHRVLNISSSIPSLVAIQSLLADSDYFKILAKNLVDAFSSVRYYPLHNYDAPSEEYFIVGEKYRKWLSDRSSAENTSETLLNKIIHLHSERPERFEELKSLIGENGLGLIRDMSVSTISFKISEEDPPEQARVLHSVRFAPGDSQAAPDIAFGNLSFGTKRILFLIVSMLYDESSVCLLEQPEDGVHAGLVDKLIPLFRTYSENTQFIIASHSTAVLNRTDPFEVRLVTNHGGATSVRALDESELSAAQQYLEEDGPLAEFLQSIVEE